MAASYKGRLLHTYEQQFKVTVLKTLIQQAEEVEKDRFVELCKKIYNLNWPRDTWIDFFVDWKGEYKSLLKDPYRAQMNSKLQIDIDAITYRLVKDIASKQSNIDKILSKGLSEKQLSKDITYQELSAFKGGLELEKDMVIDRFLQIRNLDSKAWFVESQGNSTLELSGDFYWIFNGSKLKHWEEIKTNLADFHITGTQSIKNGILEPVLSLGYISPRANNRYVLFIPKQAVIDIGTLFLQRKYGNTKSFPVYRSGQDLLLSSEIFQAFIDNQLELYRKPDKDIEFTYNQYTDFNSSSTKQPQKDMIKTALQSAGFKLDLWYSKQ